MDPWNSDGDTPAPWTLEEDESRVIVRDAEGGMVADCTDGFHGDDGWVMADKAAHVARLIAAAPELLAACLEVAQGYSTRGAEMARAAIAKATGTA